MSAFPCDQGGHEWRIIATLGDLETHYCGGCGLTRLIDKVTREEQAGSVVLNEHFERDDERLKRLAEALLKR